MNTIAYMAMDGDQHSIVAPPPKSKPRRSGSGNQALLWIGLLLAGLLLIPILMVSMSPSTDTVSDARDTSGPWILSLLPILLPLVIVGAPIIVFIVVWGLSRRKPRDIADSLG